MKQIIFTAILIFVFCFVCFSQTSENPCLKIKIKAPETVQPDEVFKVFASFEKESQPSTSKFNWTIVMENDVSKIYDQGIIEIDSKKLKDGETIIILAEALSGKCQNTAAAKIFVAPACILPSKIDEYAELPWSDEKARLENVAFQMKDLKDMKLSVFINLDNKTSQSERRNYLIKVFKYLTAFSELEKNRVTFLISELDAKSVWFQTFPKNFDSAFCDDYFVIRGEDLEKIDNLFQPKPATKKRNK